MARNQNGIVSDADIFAATGDTESPVDAGLTTTEGWPVSYSQAGGPAPQRTVFHYLMRQLYSSVADLNKQGILDWDTAITYDINAVVMGSNGTLYQAVQSNSGNDPTTDGGANWESILPDLTQYARLDAVQTWTQQQYFGAQTITPSSGSLDWNLNGNQVAAVTLTEDTTLNAPTNMKNGGQYRLLVTQDGTGGWALNFASGVYVSPVSGGDLPEVASGANEYTLLNFDSDGTVMRVA